MIVHSDSAETAAIAAWEKRHERMCLRQKAIHTHTRRQQKENERARRTQRVFSADRIVYTVALLLCVLWLCLCLCYGRRCLLLLLLPLSTEAATLSQHFPLLLHTSCMRDFVTITASSFWFVYLFVNNFFRFAEPIPIESAKKQTKQSKIKHHKESF